VKILRNDIDFERIRQFEHELLRIHGSLAYYAQVVTYPLKVRFCPICNSRLEKSHTGFCKQHIPAAITHFIYDQSAGKKMGEARDSLVGISSDVYERRQELEQKEEELCIYQEQGAVAYYQHIQNNPDWKRYCPVCGKRITHSRTGFCPSHTPSEVLALVSAKVSAGT